MNEWIPTFWFENFLFIKKALLSSQFLLKLKCKFLKKKVLSQEWEMSKLTLQSNDKNKKQTTFYISSRWLSVKVKSPFQFFVTNAFLNYQFLSYGFLVYQHYRWVSTQFRILWQWHKSPLRLPPEERLMEGSHNPMCEVFPKGNTVLPGRV